MRSQSNHPAKDGGWYHDYEKKPIYIPSKRSAPARKQNLESEYAKMEILNWRLADDMGVSLESLNSIGVRWSNFYGAWIFPLYDGSRKLIGLNRRFKDGTKKIVAGTSGGLYLPQCEPHGIVMVCEGGGDTAALVQMGFFAIGRFTCSSCTDYIKDFFRLNKIHRYILVSQNDTLKTTPNGNNFRPGQDGAKKLKKELGLSSVIFTCPNPVKDVRELLIKLGADDARNYINDCISTKVWTRY